ncbi:MAG: N-acetyltransferase [Alphaproteobacteria bacterium]|nr:N-acetyltransferase [Alphaproteobacteria bacterium]
MMQIREETPTDGPVIAELVHLALGTRATDSPAARMRAGMRPVAGLCLVAANGTGAVVGTLRFWPVRIGGVPALQLGPLAVRPERRGEGFGKALLRAGLELARGAGHRIVVLIGDPAYYRPFGFETALSLGIRLPTSFDEARLQVLALTPGALAGVSGVVGPAAGDRRPTR